MLMLTLIEVAVMIGNLNLKKSLGELDLAILDYSKALEIENSIN